MAKETDRMSRIRKARSVAEIAAVIGEIQDDVLAHEKVVSKLLSSLSSSNDEITFDHRGSAKRSAEAFKAPSATSIRKHMDVLNKLHDNYSELEAAQAMIKQSFPNNKAAKNALASITVLMKEVSEHLNDAFDSLGTISAGHQPKKLSSAVDSLVAFLIKVLPQKNYENITHETYVTLGDNSSFVFCNYVGVQNLTKDSYVFDTYYFVLTGTVTKDGEFSMYLSSFPTFKIPGRYPIGKEVTDRKSIELRTSLLLSHAGFSAKVEKLAMPVAKEDAGRLGLSTIKGVQKASINSEDELVIVLSQEALDSNKVFENVVKSVMARLCSVVRSSPTKTHFVYKKARMKIGTQMETVLKFHLIPNAEGKDIHTDVLRLDEFARDFGLSDKQKNAMLFALTH